MAPKILIVEDNFIASDEIKDRLRGLGYSDSETAFNGQEAIEKASRYLPDLILMDINLGHGTDGIEAAARIQETHHIPVIYLTAYDDEITLQRAKITEPYAYVRKPFDERELHIAIEMAIHQHEIKRQLQHALRESQKREQQIAEMLHVTHAILDVHDFQITARYVFDACKRSIGAKAGYVALLSPDGKNNDLLFLDDGGLPCTVDPNLPMPIRGLRAEAYRTGKVVYDNDFMHSEWVKFMPKGHLTLSNVLFAPLNIQGETVGVLGMSNKDGDFTEHDARLAAAFGEYAAIALHNSQTFEKLQAQNIQLQELNATKDTFFSIIAHDLKNPFIGMMAGTDMLKERIQNSNDKLTVKLVQELDTSAQRVYKLLENLLTWARVQQGRIPYTPETVDLTVSVKYCLQVLQERAARKQITCTTALENGLAVHADGDMLNAILRNLIANAIKFTPQGGTVTVTAQAHADMVAIAVTDTGVGMPADKMQRLFRVGERKISTVGTAGERGTGLGLILCKEFVEQHDGQIWVDSEEGQGSTFTFTLPREG